MYAVIDPGGKLVEFRDGEIDETTNTANREKPYALPVTDVKPALGADQEYGEPVVVVRDSDVTRTFPVQPVTIAAISAFNFLQRWTQAERNLLRRRVLQADAVGAALGDAIDMVRLRGFVNVDGAGTITFMNACVTNSILTAQRRAQILDLKQSSP